ncbi:MAG: hypothetical protein OXH95_03835 [bacterium]|nr:hypothetical protein [bacterium]
MIPVENRSLFLRLEAEGNKSLDLGDYALSLAEWDFYKNNGSDLVRINVSPSDHPVYDTKGDQEIFGTVPRWALLRLPTAENWKESSPDAGDIRSACLTSLWRSKPSSVEWASAVSLPHGSL